MKKRVRNVVLFFVSSAILALCLLGLRGTGQRGSAPLPTGPADHVLYGGKVSDNTDLGITKLDETGTVEENAGSEERGNGGEGISDKKETAPDVTEGTAQEKIPENAGEGKDLPEQVATPEIFTAPDGHPMAWENGALVCQNGAHVFGQWEETAPTCARDGEKKRRCRYCSYVEKIALPRITDRHTNIRYVFIKEANLNQDGLRRLCCLDCGAYLSGIERVCKLGVVPHIPNAEELGLLSLINASRQAVGLAPLRFETERYECALIRAKELKISYSHTRPNGSEWHTVLSENGFEYIHTVAENIWEISDAEYRGEKDLLRFIHDAFMNSPRHQANIFISDLTSVALCLYREGGVIYVEELFFAD